jgi:recombination protein RecA
VQKSGSWFSMGDERIGQGKDSVKNFLINNPDIAEDVEAKVREQLISGASGRAAARAAERPVAISADDFDDED